MTQQLATDEQGAPVIDVRGPRFSAGVTVVVLSIGVLLQGPVGVGLVAWQFVAFTIAAAAGLAWSPYGNLFRLVKRVVELGPPPATEAEGPPRFAQLCGAIVTGVALVLFAVGATIAGWVAVGVVIALATLQSLAGLCIGCEMYLLGQRLRARKAVS